MSSVPNLPKVSMAMIGGGPGSFIGPVHRIAARLDGRIDLVAGAFSRQLEMSRVTGAELGIDPARVYDTASALLEQESRRADRPDFISIVTPNHLHYPLSVAALEAGFHVLCDKPATLTLQEAVHLKTLVERTGLEYGLTYTYSGYPMVREARHRCLAGAVGTIRKVVVQYTQGWLSQSIENEGNRQAGWRTTPELAGKGGCIGDIGVHALHLLEYVTGHRVSSICAELSRVVPGRLLDDDCNALLRLDNGAPAVLVSSQIAAGERNGLSLQVHGELGSIIWHQEMPGTLLMNWRDRPSEILHAGAGYLSSAVQRSMRLPMGHPEGYIEAFATIYRDFAERIGARARGEPATENECDVNAAVRSLRFIEAATAREGWVHLEEIQS